MDQAAWTTDHDTIHTTSVECPSCSTTVMATTRLDKRIYYDPREVQNAGLMDIDTATGTLPSRVSLVALFERYISRS